MLNKTFFKVETTESCLNSKDKQIKIIQFVCLVLILYMQWKEYR